jgi:hypothetical protein
MSFLNCEWKERKLRCVMSSTSLRLIGNVSDICQPVYSSDNHEQVTVFVEGAEPLYAEIRIPNKQGWRVGQKVVVMIAPVSADDGRDSST